MPHVSVPSIPILRDSEKFVHNPNSEVKDECDQRIPCNYLGGRPAVLSDK